MRKNNQQFEEYSRNHVHLYGMEIPQLLEELFRIYNKDKFSLIDIGCGDGRILYGLYRLGFLQRAELVVGVDISEIRIKRLNTLLPFVEGVVADAQDLSIFPDNSFDIAVSSQVIEHVPNDMKMIREVYRILKPSGYLYISSVIKKRYGVWVYLDKKKGFKLDPTHLREYKSETEFLNLITAGGFKIYKYRTWPVCFPISDLIIRFLIKTDILIDFDPTFYERHPKLSRIRRICLPVLGYRFIEVLAQKP